MADSSIFIDKDAKPGEQELRTALGKLYKSWEQVKLHAVKKGPGIEEWNYSRSGWNCRVKGRKSVIVYLMPCNARFNASFVLGAKATTEALNSNVSEDIKKLISEAKVYAEGRGVRIEVRNEKTSGDIQTLIDIKLTAK